MKYNFGCGDEVLEGWVNVDIELTNNAAITPGDICSCDWIPDDSADEIRAAYIFEHLDFISEKFAFLECQRILKVGGEIEIKVPDFIKVLERWLALDDKWKGFYKICQPDDPQYGFCLGASLDFRWGVPLTWIFGSQSACGKYHQNGYSENKLRAIFKFLNFEVISFERKYERDHECMIIRGKKR